MPLARQGRGHHAGGYERQEKQCEIPLAYKKASLDPSSRLLARPMNAVPPSQYTLKRAPRLPGPSRVRLDLRPKSQREREKGNTYLLDIQNNARHRCPVSHQSTTTLATLCTAVDPGLPSPSSHLSNGFFPQASTSAWVRPPSRTNTSGLPSLSRPGPRHTSPTAAGSGDGADAPSVMTPGWPRRPDRPTPAPHSTQETSDAKACFCDSGNCCIYRPPK